MAKYMLKATYSVDGTKGLIKDGGSARRVAVQKTIEGVGGSRNAFTTPLGSRTLLRSSPFRTQ
jgi:hypothetical protein